MAADGHGMCDDCLLSFTTNTKANPKTHRLLLGKLRQVHGYCDFQTSVRRDLFAGSLKSRPCTCCGKLWKPGHSARNAFQLQPPESAAFDSKSRGLSYDGFSELKLISDSETEFPFSDDDDITSVICYNNEAGDDPMCQYTSVISSTNFQSHSHQAELKENSSTSNPEPSRLDPCVGPNICKHHDAQFLDSDFVNDNGLFEINWQQVNQNSFGSHQPNLNSLPPDAVNISKGESEKSKANCSSSHNFHSSTPLEKAVNVSQASDSGLQSVGNDEEGLKNISTMAGASKETDLIVNEQSTKEDVFRVKEELKLLSSQSFSPRGFNMSLAIPLDDAYLPATQADASSFNETLSVSVDSGLGSLDGISVSEIEGESLVDQLKRQIAYYKKCMSSLYKELEEERNASAIATNETMSMITRLQEEKAALRMESLQYLRMMEEQAEHDAHALEKADDLLSEKEKEIQDLEAELEFYSHGAKLGPRVRELRGMEMMKRLLIIVVGLSVTLIMVWFGSEERKAWVVLESLQRGLVPPSGPNPCTTIPGRSKGGHCHNN
ncbi:putative myosin-binding protein 4 [Senna tora]|uniref:Putative myosin-binding protein 4 n=1 Tax=Senna tora TaxID=362788 RepID=A0A834TCH2_9FABA|nr:putative myosin-binding protein 4 [Senna tora]